MIRDGTAIVVFIWFPIVLHAARQTILFEKVVKKRNAIIKFMVVGGCEQSRKLESQAD